MARWSNFISRMANANERPVGRVSGPPPSANGASSFHLNWELQGRFAAVEVTFEVLAPPTVPRLYFWALQAGFSAGSARHGAGHLGLQWHPEYPGSTAVNWGGYDANGKILSGTASALPGTLGNVNTRDLDWSAGRPYRLRIDRDPERGPGSMTRWRGSVTDLDTGRSVLVRALDGGGSHLVNLCVWSEVFARCDDPSVWVRWSDPVAYDDHGAEKRPSRARVNYQSHGDGGCANTNSHADDAGIVQVTATDRQTPQGAYLPFR